MKIIHYSYDHIKNPRCGGGGAYRELKIHERLSSKHEILYYCGTFKGAKNYTENGISFNFLGIGGNYLLSRIIFSIFATGHSLFIKADIIVITYSVFSPVLTFLFKPKKTILEFYHLTENEPFKKYSVFGIFPWISEIIAVIFAKNYLTLTDSMATYLKNKSSKKQVCASYTGYDTAIDTKKEKDDNYILYFGRIDKHMKGIDILLDAFDIIAKDHMEYKLIIAGRGSKKDLDWLNRRIGESPQYKKIAFHHNVTTEQKFELFHNSTFVCMPSRFEGWCISAIEAAASSKATIGTKIMGLGDSIKDGETGILVAVEDSTALADAMKKLIINKKLRKTLGKNGYEWAHNFTWERVSRLQEDFYVKIAAGQ